MEKILIGSFEFNTAKIPLSKAGVILIYSDKGVLACGYLNIEVANRFGERMAIVTGVKNFDDMLNAKIVSLSEATKDLNLPESATGKDFLLSLTNKDL